MQSGFLNDNNKVNLEPTKQKVLGSVNFDSLSMLGMDTFDTNFFSQQHIEQDSALVNSIKADRLKVLKFNKNKKRDRENLVPTKDPMEYFRGSDLMMDEEEILSLPYR